MKTIIGIGNPGKKYEKTRHNVGQMLVKFLDKNNFRLLSSDKYMNNSGEFVVKHLKYSNLDIDNLYVAHDDLDIPLGEYKITKKSPKIHNGVNDITAKLGTEDYWKIRIGVDNRDPENRIKGEEYVLQDFKKQELVRLKEVFKMISDDIS